MLGGMDEFVKSATMSPLNYASRDPRTKLGVVCIGEESAAHALSGKDIRG
jgi:hypothetical protein